VGAVQFDIGINTSLPDTFFREEKEKERRKEERQARFGADRGT